MAFLKKSPSAPGRPGHQIIFCAPSSPKELEEIKIQLEAALIPYTEQTKFFGPFYFDNRLKPRMPATIWVNKEDEGRAQLACCCVFARQARQVFAPPGSLTGKIKNFFRRH